MSTPLRPSPAFDEPKVESPLSESDDDEYFQLNTQWIRDSIPSLPNMADYPVDSDVKDLSIKGTSQEQLLLCLCNRKEETGCGENTCCIRLPCCC